MPGQILFMHVFNFSEGRVTRMIRGFILSHVNMMPILPTDESQAQ